MAKASIITPVYNCERYIEKAVHSVIEQSEEEWELLIVDDGSTDKTPEIIERMSIMDGRIRGYSLSHPNGPAFARNYVLAKARGEFICFLDGDDFYHPSRLSRAMGVFKDYPQIDIVFNATKRFSDDPFDQTEMKMIGGKEFLGIAGRHMSCVGDNVYLCDEDYYISMSIDVCAIHTSSITFRRSLLGEEDMWFPEDCEIGEDIDLWFRLSKKRTLAYVNEVLSYYRKNPLSITGDRDLWGWEMARAHEKNLRHGRDVFGKKDIIAYRKKIAYMYFTHGYDLHRNGRDSDARRAYFHAFRMCPRRNAILAFIKTFIPGKLVKRRHSGAECDNIEQGR